MPLPPSLTLGIGIAGAHIEIPDALRLRRDEEEGRRSVYACWPPPLLVTAAAYMLPLQGRHLGAGGLFALNLYEKLCYMYQY